MCDVSVIIPIYNGEKWINNCMKSIASQTIINTELKLEIIVYNDGSTDGTEKLLNQWAQYFKQKRVNFILTGSLSTRGVGAAKNGAVFVSSGNFLCFQDIDDIMQPHRIMLQWQYAVNHLNTLIGSRISRIPFDSTPRYVRWANNMKSNELKLQIYTSNGSTLLMPTWFCHRSVFDKVGGFDEKGAGTPEDLIFFHKHLELGGDLHRINNDLVIYSYHANATSLSISRECIWNIQLEKLQINVLQHWKHFTVWNAGKSGRRFVRALNPENLKKVVAFCDVDKKKIGNDIELYCPHKRKVLIKLPVIHFLDAKCPLIICVKLDLTNGLFESNLKSLNLTEGKDYFLFS
ncbi:unnamed protein product [Diatraea saccharalis]|uniref:Glycosyltransferase 2-like domain-containing protein n=1 Tax=Diatraea saccharalis TaxID=40085 RepID=A0A9N9WFL0_9NEOP|nr:unnamed protein product [Diatraea saccharalis]